MKKFIMLLLIGQFVWVTATFAQFKKNDLDYQLSFGTSHPIGDYADDNFNNENAGFAKTGIYSNFGFHYFVSDNFSLKAEYMYFNNPVDNQKLADSYFNEFGQQYNITVKTWDFRVSSFLLGPNYHFNLVNNKLFFYANPMIGVTTATFPRHELTIDDNSTKIELVSREAKETHLSYLANIGFDYAFSKSAIGLNFLIFVENFEFTQELEGPGYDNTTNRLDQNMDAINISLKYTGRLFNFSGN